MKTSTRILSLLLALVMGVTALASCSSIDPVLSSAPGTTVGIPDTTGVTTPPTDGTDPAEPGSETTAPATEPSKPDETTPSETAGSTECSHSYGNWTTTKAATCETNGSRNRKCSKCGDTQQEVIAAAGHAWDEGTLTTVPTTCFDTGVRMHTCTVCGETKSEQVTGNHAFGDWEYEEYQYTVDYGKDHPGYVPGWPTTETYTSHRKVHKCTRCGYTENDGTPDHICQPGTRTRVITTVKKGVCGTPDIMRSTCTICGWYDDYNGAKGKHDWQVETRHLSDYTEYTNEIDADIGTCALCGEKFVSYTLGKGYFESRKYYCDISIDSGEAYMGGPVYNDFRAVEHPEWQMVRRDFVYDDDGYVIQFTVYWWYNGQRYSQVINCGPGEIEALFSKKYDRTVCYHLRVFGTYVAAYKVSWSG